MSKATNAFWISKRTFGMKWGLKPKMIYWIYSTIVRPKITYAALVWWPKTKEKHAQKKLEKLQRLATVSITGAMRSTPTKALDALLNLLPLHQFVQLEAGKQALRLKRSKKLYEGDLVGHLRILKDIKINSLVTNMEDWMPKRYNFNRLYNVLEPSRDEWESGGPQISPESIIFYTDGSKMNNRTGAGVTGPGVNFSLSMGKWPTVFQAEIQAIVECISICSQRKYKYGNICIFSDSQAALKALKSYEFTSKLVWECMQSIQKLCVQNKVTLYWVPGHCGVDGNEKADTLARLGSNGYFIGPEPFCGTSACALKFELKNWEKSTIQSNWSCTITARQSKRFIKPNASSTQKLLNISKKDLSAYTGLITGHCPSRYHLKQIRRLQNDTCRFCNSERETSEHLLCNCGVLFNLRCRLLDKGLLQPSDVWEIAPKKVIQYIRCAIPSWDEAWNQPTVVTHNNSALPS